MFFDVDSILKGGEKGTVCALNKWKLMTYQMRANTIWKIYLLGKLPHYIEILMESNKTNFHDLHLFLFQLLLDMSHPLRTNCSPVLPGELYLYGY